MLTIFYLFFLKIFRIVGDEINQSKNPLITVINPKTEKIRKVIVLILSLPW
jgi:hypothetical protein